MASVFDGVPQLQGVDFQPGLAALVEGLQQRFKNQELQKQNLLSQAIGGQLAGGDYLGAAGAAFGSGEISTGLKIHELAQNEKKQFAETVQRYTFLADTPGKWESLRSKLTEITGEDPGDFETGRADLLGEFGDLENILSANEQAGQEARAEDTAVRDAERLALERRRVELAEQTAAGKAAEPPKETALDRARARSDVSAVSDYREAADTARATLSNIQQLRELRKGVGYEGGVLTGTRARIGGVLGTGAGQSVHSKATELQLAFTERTKGAISDREMAMFGGATPGLEMTDKAADNVMTGMEAATRRVVEQGKFFESWLDEYGKLAGAQEAWDRYVTENPIIETDGKGNISVNKNNVRNWDKYLGGGPDVVAGPEADENTPPQAFIDAGGDAGDWRFVEDKEAWQ